MQSKNAFTSPKARDLKQRNFAVPRLRLGPISLVLIDNSKFHSLTPTLCMEIEASILPLHINPINLNIPWLIVELVPFSEAYD
jgi:hypothetical protein